jgi:hypothetical protein
MFVCLCACVCVYVCVCLTVRPRIVAIRQPRTSCIVCPLHAQSVYSLSAQTSLVMHYLLDGPAGLKDCIDREDFAAIPEDQSYIAPVPRSATDDAIQPAALIIQVRGFRHSRLFKPSSCCPH